MIRSLLLKIFGRRRIWGTKIPANPEKQSNRGRDSYFYRPSYYSEEIVCKDCGKLFIFSAEQKKQYYEGGGNIYAKIVRCPSCYQEEQRGSDRESDENT